MRTIGMALLMLVIALMLATLGGVPAQAVGNAAPLAQAAPEATVYPAGKAGTVLAARLNVRAGASAAQRQIGALTRGTRVQVLQRQGAWLQILYPAGPGGRGWVSASYVAVDGEPTPAVPGASQTRTAPRVAAPRAISYNEPVFTWEWSGLDQVAGMPWYFDIRLFTRSGSDPYHVIPATLADVRQKNGVWELNYRYQARCDSYWVVQIAKGTPTNYQGWVSETSNWQVIGEACPVPTPDCQDCGG